MKNSIRMLITLSIVLFISCGKADSENTVNPETLKNQNFQVRDVVLEKREENRLRTRWTAPVEADRVDYYLVELHSGDIVITRRVSAGETELEIAVPNGSYRTSVAVVAAGIVETSVAGNQEQVVETKATVPGDVKITAQDLSTAMTSVEHAQIEVKWRAPTEFGKIHSGTDAEPVTYILYWKKGTEVGTIDYEGRLTVEKDASTGVLATNANIEALPPDTDYAVRVVVENGAGLRSEGVAQTIKTAAAQATAPTAPIIQAPSIVSIGTASDATLSFSWTAPASSGTDYKGDEAGIREYRIYWEEGESVSTASRNFLTLTKDAVSVSIPGLKNETEYSFMVVVVANGGLSAESAAERYTTAAQSQAEAPSAVANFTATAAADKPEITLGWDAHGEAANGKKRNGAPAAFVAYHIYWVEGTEAVHTGTADMQITSSATTSHLIAREFLQGGRTYTISIVVENSEALRSIPVTQQVEIRDFAAAPSTITPTLTSTVTSHTKAEIEVSWTAPGDPGKDSNNEAAQIDKYILTWIEGTTIPTGEGTTQELAADVALWTLSGLEPGKTYTIAVVAGNTAGQQGTAAEATESIPASQESDPAAPILEDASITTQSTSTEARIAISWTKPAAGMHANGDAGSIASYVLYWKESSDSVSPDDYTGKQNIAGTETSSTIQNLAVSTEYALLLVAESSNGRTASSKVAVKSTEAASTAVAPAAVTDLTATAVGAGTERTKALTLSWTAPSSFGQDIDGNTSLLSAYYIYLQVASELAEGEAVAVGGTTAHTTTNTEYTIPAEDLEGGTVYRLAVVVENSDGATSEAVEVEGTTHDLSVAPEAVGQIHVDISYKEPNETKIYWDPVNGKDKNGATVAAVYQIYKGESSNGYADAQDLISKAGAPHAIKVNTTGTINGAEKVVYIIGGLDPNIRYDIVVIAEHSENAELKSTPTLKAGVLSNGISSFVLLQGHVELVATSERNLEVGKELTLNVYMESHNVATEIRWVSEDPTIATVKARSTGTETADITAASIGDVKIRAISEADATKSAEVTIKVKKTDISDSTLSYVANMETWEGESEEVGKPTTTIPDGANVKYTLDPTVAGVEIGSRTGRIAVGVGLVEGNYAFTVVATVPAENASYTGTVRSNQITLRVQRSDIVYKPVSVESRKILSVGDADDPWLILVKNLDPGITVSELRGVIIITDQEDTVLYEERDILLNSFEDEDETVVGFGPSIDDSSWTAITHGALRIKVEIYLRTHKVYHRIFDVDKGIAEGIYSWRDLDKMREDLTKDYVIQNNIDFPVPGTYGLPVQGFEPIGKDNMKGNHGHQGTAFSGALDGGGYSIRGLVVNDASLDYVGLFGKIEAGTTDTVVKNLVLENPYIIANAMTGALVGYLSAGEIENVAVRGTAGISSVYTDGTVKEVGIDTSLFGLGYTGGLAGGLGSGKILQCSSEIPVSGKNGIVGGLVGKNNKGTVSGYATGDVLGNGIDVGGLVGKNSEGTVIGYATGDVSGSDSVGGLVGRNDVGTIIGYATGDASGSSNIGGLVGWNNGLVTGYARGTVERNFGLNTSYGLLLGYGVGKGYYSLAESSFTGISKEDVTGLSGIFLPMKEETAKEAFFQLDFTNGPWRWVADGQWPAIDIGDIKPIGEQPTERSDSVFPEDTCDTVVENRPEYSGEIYQIDSWQELQWMENCLYANYRLVADIAIPAPGQENVPEDGFNPVGSSINQFTGHLDGGGYTISGLSLPRSGSSYVGLFGYVYGGRIENLHIEHNGVSGDSYVGALAGYTAFAEIKKVSMESKSGEKVSGINYVGGLVGTNYEGTVTGYATGEVSGTGHYIIGGLVGYNSGTVTGYTTGVVSGTGQNYVGYVGGLVGVNYEGTVTGYATGVISGEDYVGGLAGETTKGIVTGYTGEAVSGEDYVGGLVGSNNEGIVTGYVMRAVSGNGDNVGGLVGNNGGTTTGYWDQETTSAGTVEGTVVGISSVENIYYYTAESEDPGREQNKYYDKGTGIDPNIPDSNDNQIFSHGDFPSIFDLPEADGRWPKLEKNFTVGGKAITLPDEIHSAQENVVNFGTTNAE